MNTIKFTNSEKNLIEELLLDRMHSYLRNQVPKKLVQDIKSTISRINLKYDTVYSKSHKSQIISCINELLSPLEERLDYYFNLPSVDFLNLTTIEKKELQLFDLCFSILEKTGFRKKTFRFEDIYQKIEKLKKSKEICISKTDNRNVYKIAFICGLETMHWEIGSELNLLYKEFTLHSQKEVNCFTKTFSECLSREEARTVIKEAEPAIKNNSTLDLTIQLLVD